MYSDYNPVFKNFMLKSTPKTAVAMIMQAPMEKTVSVQNFAPPQPQAPQNNPLRQPKADTFENSKEQNKKNYLRTALKLAWLAIAAFALYKTFSKKTNVLDPKAAQKTQQNASFVNSSKNPPKKPMPQSVSSTEKKPFQFDSQKVEETMEKHNGNGIFPDLSSDNIPENDKKFISAVESWRAKNYTEAEKTFENTTGVKLLCPGPNEDFLGAVYELQKMNEKGIFPENINHIVMGHGVGSSADGTWCFLDGGEGVFEYIDRTVPKGQNAFVVVCETSGDFVKGKPAIGKPVTMDFKTPENPAKIICSGKHEIIGHFLSPEANVKNSKIQSGLVIY